MSLQFVRAKPLQACKLAAIVVVLLFTGGVLSGFVPGRGPTSLFLVPVLALAVAVAVAAETLLAGYRSARTGGSPTDRFAARPLYAVVRAGEVLLVVLSVGAFVFVVSSLPDGPMAGPGAIGLWFLVVGLGLLVLAGSLVRTLTEYYYQRRSGT